MYANIDLSKSIEIYRECLEDCKNIFGVQSDEYAECLVSSCNIFEEPYENGISVLSRAIDIKRKCGKDTDSFYFVKLHSLSVLYHLQNKWQQVYDVSFELVEKTRQYIINNFRNLSATERESLWKYAKQNLSLIESMATSYTQYAIENNDYSLLYHFGSLAYDTRLLKKGLLLTSSQKLSSLIENSDDPQVSVILNKIKNLKSSYEEQTLDNIEIREQLKL